MHVYMDKHAYIPVIELYPHQLTSVSSGLFLSNGLLRKNYLLDALIDHLKAHTWELLVQLQVRSFFVSVWGRNVPQSYILVYIDCTMTIPIIRFCVRVFKL